MTARRLAALATLAVLAGGCAGSTTTSTETVTVTSTLVHQAPAVPPSGLKVVMAIQGWGSGRHVCPEGQGAECFEWDPVLLVVNNGPLALDEAAVSGGLAFYAESGTGNLTPVLPRPTYPFQPPTAWPAGESIPAGRSLRFSLAFELPWRGSDLASQPLALDLYATRAGMPHLLLAQAPVDAYNHPLPGENTANVTFWADQETTKLRVQFAPLGSDWQDLAVAATACFPEGAKIRMVGTADVGFVDSSSQQTVPLAEAGCTGLEDPVRVAVRPTPIQPQDFLSFCAGPGGGHGVSIRVLNLKTAHVEGTYTFDEFAACG